MAIDGWSIFNACMLQLVAPVRISTKISPPSARPLSPSEIRDTMSRTRCSAPPESLKPKSQNPRTLCPRLEQLETFQSCSDPLGLRPFSFGLDSIFELTPFLMLTICL